jgi:hypothetical protein
MWAGRHELSQTLTDGERNSPIQDMYGLCKAALIALQGNPQS